MKPTTLSIIFIIIAVSNIATITAQQCNAKDFVVSNGQEVLFKISSTKEVHACEVNICDQLNAAMQTLSLSDDKKIITISNGNSISLPDDSATNELQTLSINNGILSLSNDGGTVTLPDASSTNEIQALSVDNSGVLSLSASNSVQLPDPSSSNEIQSLSLTNGTLSLSQSNSVSLARDSAFGLTAIMSSADDIRTVLMTAGGDIIRRSITVPGPGIVVASFTCSAWSGTNTDGVNLWIDIKNSETSVYAGTRTFLRTATSIIMPFHTDAIFAVSQATTMDIIAYGMYYGLVPTLRNPRLIVQYFAEGNINKYQAPGVE